MPGSFFERLTGGFRTHDDSEEPMPERSADPVRSVRSVKSAPESKPPRSLTAEAPDGDELEKEHERTGEGEEGQLTVDIYDDGAAIVVQSSVAGCRPEDIDISLEDNMLTIRGARSRTHQVDDGSFYYRELYWGAFSRSIILPEEVDFSKADAAIRNGLLTIKLPKKDRGAKKLKVKVGE